MADKDKKRSLKDMQEEYNKLCQKVKGYPAAVKEMEEHFQKLKKRQLSLSEEMRTAT